MSVAVSVERWREAQRAEQSYCDELLSDGSEFARPLAEKGYAAAWAEQQLLTGPPDGDYSAGSGAGTPLAVRQQALEDVSA